MNRLTIVGARGFIGGRLVDFARRQGYEVFAVSHDAVPSGTPLGVVIYCSGMAWGSNREPVRAFEIHATGVGRIIASCTYDRVVYLSSTRIYDRSVKAVEDCTVSFCVDEANDIYAMSKAAGEAIVLAASGEHRVVRLSNVYGPSFRSELFLSDVLRQAVTTGNVAIRSSPNSEKDYVSVDDVVHRVLEIAANSKERLYNVASGTNTTHAAILDAIASTLPITIQIAPDAPFLQATPVSIGRLRDEFPFTPRRVIDDIPALVHAFKAHADSKV